MEETLGTIGWLAVVAIVLAGLAFFTSAWGLVALRSWRREDRAWKDNFLARWTAVESRTLGSTLPETPPLRPAFTGRDSAEPDYGSPPGPESAGDRMTWAPPSKRKR